MPPPPDLLSKVCESAATLADTSDKGCSTQAYLAMFTSLSELLSHMGMVFSFVTKDINSKIDLLQSYLAERGEEKAGTLVRMVEYEVENDLTQNPRGKSASRTLLRLHRAVLFFKLFLDKVLAGDPNSSAYQPAYDSYKVTMHDHHIWLVRKTVGVALQTLGTGKSILASVRGAESEEKAMQMIPVLLVNLGKCADVVQAVYEKHNLLELP